MLDLGLRQGLFLFVSEIFFFFSFLGLSYRSFVPYVDSRFLTVVLQNNAQEVREFWMTEYWSGVQQNVIQEYSRMLFRSIAECCSRVQQNVVQKYRRMLFRSITECCSGVQQNLVHEYSRILERSIAECQRGVQQNVVKEYSRMLERSIAEYFVLEYSRILE